MLQKTFLLAGSIFAGLGVAIGAFGAHKLKPFLEQTGKLDTFEKGVTYQFYHSLALLLVGLLISQSQLNAKYLGYAGYSFIGGILVFSGSLYILCLTETPKWGAVTPIGGLLMIAGWVFVVMSVLKGSY
ncbi:MAG: DUF423 domain-containing protein [Cytophagales bacterium]|nr:DUF423 domain-containing protein [Cytophaga sp.]